MSSPGGFLEGFCRTLRLASPLAADAAYAAAAARLRIISARSTIPHTAVIAR